MVFATAFAPELPLGERPLIRKPFNLGEVSAVIRSAAAAAPRP